jgi:hypothetical protein
MFAVIIQQQREPPTHVAEADERQVSAEHPACKARNREPGR